MERMLSWRPWFLVLLCAQAAGAEESLEDLLDRAGREKAEGRFEECLATLSRAVARASEDPARAALAQCRLGECRLAMAQPGEAERELRKVALEFPDQPEAVSWADVALIDALTFQGRHADAGRCFEALSARYAAAQATPLQLAWASVKRARGLERLGEKEAALGLLAEVRSLEIADPGPAVAAGVMEGEILLAAGWFNRAAESLAALAVAAAPVDPHQAWWAQVRRSEALQNAHRYSEAVAAARAVTGADPALGLSPEQLVWASIFEARALLLEGRRDEAAQALARARATIEVPPDAPPRAPTALGYDVLLRSGELYRDWKRDEEALAYYEKALEHAKKHELGEEPEDRARAELAEVLARLDQPRRAVALLRSGIQNPASLSGPDLVLSGKIAELLGDEGALTWHRFLEDPFAAADPTAESVRAELGSDPPAPASPAAELPFAERIRVAELHYQRGALDAALEALERAAEAARGPGDAGLLSLRRVECYAHKRERSTTYEARVAFGRQAEEEARRGVEEWLEVVRTEEGGAGHFAVESALRCYREAGLLSEAEVLAERLVAELAGAKDPSQEAFARFQRLRLRERLGWSHAELGADARAIWERYRNREEPAVREICGLALQWGTYYHAMAGDVAAGAELLGLLESELAERFHAYGVEYRERWGLPPRAAAGR